MKYLRRGIWFIALRLLMICLVGGIAMTVFYYAMNVSNIQIILKDGFACRAKVIMGITDDSDELNRYFHKTCLDTDEDLSAAKAGNSPYADYTVRGLDHRLEMGFLWTWPWDSTVRLNITERVPKIDGRVRGSKAEEAIARDGERGLYPPDWSQAKYRVNLVKENGQWKVRSMTKLAE